MELEEAQELAYNSDDYTSYFELHELCEKIREELQEIIDEEKESNKKAVIPEQSSITAFVMH